MNNQVHITGADYKLSAYIFRYIKESFSGKHNFSLFPPEMFRVIQLAAGLKGNAGTIRKNNCTRLGISRRYLKPLDIGICSLSDCPYGKQNERKNQGGSHPYYPPGCCFDYSMLFYSCTTGKGFESLIGEPLVSRICIIIQLTEHNVRLCFIRVFQKESSEFFFVPHIMGTQKKGISPKKKKNQESVFLISCNASVMCRSTVFSESLS